ncbi:CobQ/CobB/MinD/ParA nucleotide binding domain-containing protein [Cohaesibacter marisflavi]|uniref:CobQ/CobB/MinD/ParA nucleotide binding domain-containing protein n=1 Tax=Cohaesibacter marisflavi TaxID=655353 RepID=A0A1I5MGC1_9HYPH|nr:hypothetical protein [Cohaesibacter marisflavi]SFP08632.1 CobQ/CobB/MinD/ParA nucleotide binding domain-containing protein [Cohaesibacter marisflavi]
MEKTFHLVLQAKGGIGKSLTASIIAQYYSHRAVSVTAVDCDPSTPTFSTIPGLKAIPLQIMEEDDINPRCFDQMIETIVEAEAGERIICDIGTSAYVPFTSYLIQNVALPFLQDSGTRVLIHSPICGGPAFQSTLDGLGELISQFETAQFVIWENEFFGPVGREGKSFSESKFFQTYKDRIFELLLHPRVQQATFGADIRAMMEQSLTFEAAIQSPDFKIMSRQRLRQIWKSHVTQLDQSRLSAALVAEEAAE